MFKILVSVLIFTFSLIVNANEKRDVAGLWETEEKGVTVIIKEDENGLPSTGTLTQFPRKPEKVGMALLSNFSKNEDGWNVTLYSPRRDKNFDAVIYRKNQELNLEVDAGFFTHHIIWTALETNHR